MAKAKLGLGSMNLEQKLALANVMKTAMTGNANFPTPNPTLAAFSTLITNAQTGLTNWDNNEVTRSNLLNARDAGEVALTGGMTLLASYVDNTSGGDKTKIESAGMSTRATNAAVGPMPQVAHLDVTAGDFEGTLDVAWDSVKGAGSYEIQTSVDPISGTSWAFKAIANKSSATLNGFTSGARIWVHVRAIGADNSPGPWSDPAVKTVP